MPKYWGKQIFTHGSFPEVGQKQKTERERPKVGNNNGQLCIANVTSDGARKPPGPKSFDNSILLKNKCVYGYGENAPRNEETKKIIHKTMRQLNEDGDGILNYQVFSKLMKEETVDSN